MHRRKKNIIGYEELFNSTRRQVITVWWDGIISGNKSSENLAMMVMVDTQTSGQAKLTYPKRKFKGNGK